ncbi:MAG: hypothetical protein IJO06_08815 [Thermoguttaceae bacterium]|nr:hypothetical protein [Thermoguttaceae bacterium]
MSETKINSDGSATLTISGSSAPLEKALDSALKALDGFVKSASQALAAFDAYAAKGLEGVASTFDKAFGGIRRQTEIFVQDLRSATRGVGDELKPLAEAARDAFGSGGRSKPPKSPSASPPNDETPKPGKPSRKVDVSSISAAFNAATLGALKGGAQYALESVVGLGDALDKMSKRTGFGVEALSTLSYAATQCGTDVETVEGAIRGYQSVLADAAEKLSRLRLDAAKLVALSPEEQLRALFDALGRIEDPTRRAAAAMEIMGDDGAKLGPIFADGTATLDAFAAEAREVGAVMSGEQAAASAELASATNRLKGSLQGVAVQLGGALLPALRRGAEALTALVRGFGEFATARPEVVQGLAEFAALSASAFGTGCVVKRLAEYGAAFLGLVPKVAAASKALLAFAATNPVATFVALTAAVGGYFAVRDAAFGGKASWSDEAAGILEAGNAMRTQDEQRLARLQELAEKQALTKTEIAEAVSLAAELKSRYGDVGVEVDALTGKIKIAAGAQAELNRRMLAAKRKETEAALAEAKANGADGVIERKIADEEVGWDEALIGKKRGQTWGDYFTSWDGWYDSTADLKVAIASGDKNYQAKVAAAKAANAAEIEKLEAELAGLDAVLNAPEETATDSGTGGGSSGEANAASSETVAAKEAEAKAVEDLNARIAKAEEDRAAREMSASKRRIEAIKKETKALTDAIDARLEALRASASTEDDFAEIHRLETAKAGIEADGKARVADVEKEEADKKDAERERLNDQIAAEEERVADESRTDEERRLAQIDKETAAYKELLSKALALAETEEERAEIQAKIDAADATAKERKDAVLAASKAAEEEAKARRELAEVGNDAFGGEEDAASFFDSVDAGANVAARTVSSGATFSALDAQKLGANNPAEENVKATLRTNELLGGIVARMDEFDFTLRAA